jgi:hypothetical protein
VVAKSVGEAELLAENKIGDYVEWSRELLEELGYPQDCVPMYVDSTCVMQMMNQGTGSFKRAEHIKVRYFWMKDLIDQGKIELIYVRTDELVADVLTKPMSGGKFQYLLFKLIGWNHIMSNDNYIDKSLSCQGGVLEYQYGTETHSGSGAVGLDEGAVGPVYQSTP